MLVSTTRLITSDCSATKLCRAHERPIGHSIRKSNTSRANLRGGTGRADCFSACAFEGGTERGEPCLPYDTISDPRRLVLRSVQYILP